MQQTSNIFIDITGMRVIGMRFACMPVVVIRLELKLGKVSLMVSFLTKPEVLLLILFQLLEVIST